MNALNTQTTKDAIYAGRAVKSFDASPSAQAWLRKEALAGRVAKLTGIEGWCPAHSRWTFYVSSNHAPAFLDKCAEDVRQRNRAILLDAHPDSPMSRNARDWHGQALEDQQAKFERLFRLLAA